MNKHHINSVFFVIILVLFASCSPSERVEKKGTTALPIIPQPNNVTVYEGNFTFDNPSQLIVSNPTQKKIGNWFIEELQKVIGWSCSISETSGSENNIILIQDESLEPEAYFLDVNATGITIKASSEAGYFYAFQTLLQLFPVAETKSATSINVSQVRIEDQPNYEWRGVLIDLSRHFFGPASIKEFIDQMAAQKLNRLHLHLSDDPGWRIEIKEYPKLHEIGSIGDRSNPEGPQLYLTEEQAREITQYANDRQITMVPEIDLPGHSGAIGRAYPEFYGGNNTLNVSNDDAIKMVETVFLRVADIFNTKYVHFGSDEVRKHRWDERADMQAKMKELGLNNQKELEGWFDKKIADFIIESGLNPVAWDEAADFGVNKNTIVQWWRCRNPEVLEEVLKAGSKTILSPADFVYLDYPSDLDEAGGYWEGLRNGPNTIESIYNWKAVPDSFSAEMKKNIIGIEAGIWTEFISNQKRFEYMTYPRILAVAEKAWTTDTNLNWESFQKRLDTQYIRYDRAGINYRIPNLSIEERKQKQPEAFEGPIPSIKLKE